MSSTLRYLLDTDICIYLLNGNSRIKEWVAAVGVDTLSVAIPSVAELYFGAYNSARVGANLVRVRAFLTPPAPAVLPIDEASAQQFGRFKATLRRAGTPIGDLDILIAAVAAAHGLTVVTNNTGHFERVPGISVENWLTSPSPGPQPA